MFGDKLLLLRREKGLSQEQLADMLNVTRQSVSKWEAGGTTPELEKIVALSDIFGVSVDYLVRENTVERDQLKTVVTTADNTAVMEQLGEIRKYMKESEGYEYKSQACLYGIPLVHIRFSSGFRQPAVAKGIIAIGNIAVGVVSLGAVATGIFSFGGISLGLLLAFGATALGSVSLGGIGIGIFACGGIAIGYHAMGGVAVAAELAVGGVAIGRVAIGDAAYGEYTLLIEGVTREAIREFAMQHYPKMWGSIAKLLAVFGQ